MNPALERALRGLLLATAAASVAALALTPIVTADFFQIEATGRWIVENAAIPYRDPFSFTAKDQLWIEHKWLFDVGVHLLFRGFGAAGPLALKIALMLAILAGVLRHARGAGAAAAAAVLLVLAVVAFPDRFTVRAHVAAYACLVWFHALLAARRADPGRPLWPLVVVQLIWANVHGSFILGPALVVLYGLGDVANRRLGLGGAGALVRQPRLAAAVGLATLLNPYGPLLYLSPLQHFTRDTQSAVRLAEWQAPVWSGFSGSGQALILALAVLAAALAVRLARRRGDVAAALVVVALAVLALGSYRFVLPFALTAIPLLAIKLPAAPAVGTAAVIALAAPAVLARLPDFSARIDAPRMPVAAADDLIARGVRGRVFNSFDYGAYLAARLHPAVTIYVDGRLDLYDAAVFADYSRALEDPDTWRRVRDAGDINLVVLEYAAQPPAAARLMDRLLASGEWATTFIGPRAAVLEHRAGGAAAYEVLRPRLDLGYLPPPDAPERVRQAWAESARLIAVRPPFAHAWIVRGAVARRHPDPSVRDAACDVYQDGLAQLPGHGALLFQLAGCFGDAGRFAEAAAIFDRLVLWPRFREGALVYLGLTLARLGDLEAAERAWKAVVDAYPNNRHAPRLLEDIRP